MLRQYQRIKTICSFFGAPDAGIRAKRPCVLLFHSVKFPYSMVSPNQNLRPRVFSSCFYQDNVRFSLTANLTITQPSRYVQTADIAGTWYVSLRAQYSAVVQ